MISVEFSGINEMALRLLQYEKDQRERTRLACAEIARWLEAYAITHHPWTVLTQATNLTTRGSWDQVADDLYEFAISAGMDYDVFLEVGAKQYATFTGEGGVMQTRWSWIWRTLLENRQQIMETFQRHLSV